MRIRSRRYRWKRTLIQSQCEGRTRLVRQQSKGWHQLIRLLRGNLRAAEKLHRSPLEHKRPRRLYRRFIHPSGVELVHWIIPYSGGDLECWQLSGLTRQLGEAMGLGGQSSPWSWCPRRFGIGGWLSTMPPPDSAVEELNRFLSQ